MTLRDILALGRIQTAPLTASVICLGAISAGAAVLSPLVLGLFAFGLLVHYTGFAHNNFHDLEHDRKSEFKVNFPSLKMKESTIGAIVLLSVLLTWVIALLAFPLDITIPLMWFMVTGIEYNRQSKKSPLYATGIAGISYACLAWLGTAAYGEYTDQSYIVMVISASMMMYAVGPQGALKDLQDENNIATWMGSYKKYNRVRLSLLFGAFSFTLFTMYVVSVICLMTDDSIPTLYDSSPDVIIALFTIGPAFVFHLEYFNAGTWDHNYRMKVMMFALILPWYGAVALVTDVFIGAGFATGSLVWLVVFNKWFWGTGVGPKV